MHLFIYLLVVSFAKEQKQEQSKELTLKHGIMVDKFGIMYRSRKDVIYDSYLLTFKTWIIILEYFDIYFCKDLLRIKLYKQNEGNNFFDRVSRDIEVRYI